MNNRAQYEEWLEQVIEICDRKCEHFDNLADSYSFRIAFNNKMTPSQAFDDACSFEE